MANKIRIYRSASTNTPGSLLQGELANSEVGSPNGINEFFIGTTGPTVFKLIRNVNGAPAEPTAGLTNGTIDAANDYIPFEDVTDGLPKRVTMATLMSTTVVGGTGIEVTGASGVRTVAVDYAGVDNFIDSATSLEGTPIATGDTIVYHDATDNNVKKGFVSDLPFLSAEADTLSSVTGRGATTATLSTFSGGINMSDSDLNRPTLEDYAIKHTAPTVSANAVTVDCTLGNSFLIDMDPATAAVTLTLSNPAPSGSYCEVNLMIVMGTPAYGMTWPGSIVWQNGGAAPVLSGTNNDVDMVHLFTVDGGTTWYGTYALAQAAGGGSVTQVNTGTGLSGGPITSTGTIDLDFDNLAEKTGALVGTDRLTGVSGTTHFSETINQIPLSIFSKGNFVETTDTGSATWTWVIDDDTMATASATTLPTSESVKAYVDSVVASGVTYKGGFDPTAGAGAGSPNLNSITSAVGDMYTVTVAGTYNFTTGTDPVLEVGDVLISEVAGVNSNGDNWTVVQTNIDVIDGGTF